MYKLAEQVGKTLQDRGWSLVVAESCTGGGLAQAITSVPGSSKWFDRGFVTYSHAAKEELLDVSPKTIEQFGAVSEEVAKAMAEGALKHSHAQISTAITGIAGPNGGTEDKPIGMVCFAWASIDADTGVETQHFTGDRQAVREQAVEWALKTMLKHGKMS